MHVPCLTGNGAAGPSAPGTPRLALALPATQVTGPLAATAEHEAPAPVTAPADASADALDALQEQAWAACSVEVAGMRVTGSKGRVCGYGSATFTVTFSPKVAGADMRACARVHAVCMHACMCLGMHHRVLHSSPPTHCLSLPACALASACARPCAGACAAEFHGTCSQAPGSATNPPDPAGHRPAAASVCCDACGGLQVGGCI